MRRGSGLADTFRAAARSGSLTAKPGPAPAPPTTIPPVETEEERERRVRQWETWLRGIDESARGAWKSGREFYVIKLSLGGSTAGWMTTSTSEGDDVAGALQAIEAVGWQLDSSGYVYQPLRERSHALTDTQQMTGNVIGIYTFRRPQTEPPPAPPI
jgi:hypothetical protein